MIFCCKIIKFVHVAQWIERSPPERKAVGSNPARDASKHAENL